MSRYLLTLVETKRRAPTEDLLSDLVHASDEGDQLCEVELVSMIFLLLVAGLLAANRDSDRFDEPDRFDVTRSASGHLAFGHGIHYCVGAPLARLEAEIAVGRLLERFGDLRLAAEPETLRWRDSTLMHGLEMLPVCVD
jgi:cytochrome P450